MLLDMHWSEPRRFRRMPLFASKKIKVDPKAVKQELRNNYYGEAGDPAKKVAHAELTVGAEVMVEGYCKGVVRYIGPHATKDDDVIRIGVELEKPVGNNDGTVAEWVPERPSAPPPMCARAFCRR